MVRARVTGHSSSHSRSSRRRRGRRVSARGASRPTGSMLHRAEQAGRGGSREPERGERESEGDDGVPTVDVGDPASRPRLTRGWSQDARQTRGDPQCRLTAWPPGGDRIFPPRLERRTSGPGWLLLRAPASDDASRAPSAPAPGPPATHPELCVPTDSGRRPVGEQGGVQESS